MMFFIFYNAPSGLNLYVMASSFFGTIEQWRIRTHIREREAAGTLHKPLKEKVLATAMETGTSGQSLPNWLQRLQKMAEDAQKLKSQRQEKGKKRP
jgi:membrane protein insertase Oxa1/YidC/SpoIIIJ